MAIPTCSRNIEPRWLPPPGVDPPSHATFMGWVGRHGGPPDSRYKDANWLADRWTTFFGLQFQMDWVGWVTPLS